MLRQRCRIIDPCGQRGSAGVLRRLNDPDDGQLFTLFHKVLHVLIITGLICPHLILAVILITVRGIYNAELYTENIVIIICPHILRNRDILFIHKLLYHLVQLQRIPESKRIEQEIAHTSAGCEDNHAFVIVFRPAPRLHIILSFIELLVFRHLAEHIGAHHGRHHTVGI